MSSIFIFNIFVFTSIGLILLFNKWLYKKAINDFLNPSFTFILFLLIFFFNTNTEENNFSVYTGFLVMVGTLSWIAGFYFNGYKYFKLHKLMPSFEVKPLNIPHYIIIQCVLLVASFMVTYLKIRSFGYSIQQYLLNALLVEDQNVKEGGNYWMLFYALIKIPFMVNHFRLITNGKNFHLKLGLVALVEFLFALTTLTSSRIVYIMGFAFVFFLYFRAKNKRPALNIYTGTGLVLLFPILNILNKLRSGDFYFFQNFQVSDLWGYGQHALNDDANPGVNFDLLVKYIGKTGDYHWGFFFISQLFFVIPRFLWPNKPITSLDFAYTIKVMHEHPVQDGTTYTFTVFDVYAAFGILSLVLMMILLGVLTRYFYVLMYDKAVNCILVIFSTSIILYYTNVLRASFADISAYYIMNLAISFFYYVLYRRLRIFR